MPFYTCALSICLDTYLKTVCYLTKATLPPQRSQKHEIYDTPRKMEISHFSDILVTVGRNGVRMIKWQLPKAVPGRRPV